MTGHIAATSPSSGTPGPSVAPMPTAVAQAIGLTKIYGVGEAAVTALDDASVEFARGRLAAIMGPRVGQVDADALHGGPGLLDVRPHRHRRSRHQ
jgi:hypothetical protein